MSSSTVISTGKIVNTLDVCRELIRCTIFKTEIIIMDRQSHFYHLSHCPSVQLSQTIKLSHCPNCLIISLAPLTHSFRCFSSPLSHITDTVPTAPSAHFSNRLTVPSVQSFHLPIQLSHSIVSLSHLSHCPNCLIILFVPLSHLYHSFGCPISPTVPLVLPRYLSIFPIVSVLCLSNSSNYPIQVSHSIVSLPHSFRLFRTYVSHVLLSVHSFNCLTVPSTQLFRLFHLSYCPIC